MPDDAIEQPGEQSAEPAPQRSRRHTFGPVVLAGLAGAGAAAVGGHRAMLTVPESTVTAAGGLALGVDERSVQFPLAGALALVALAAWGALLVTRGVVRRVVAVLAALAALGSLVVVVVGGFAQADEAAADLAVQLGIAVEAVEVERSVWLWVTAAGALVALVAAVAAVRLVPDWPEMGARYDAPTGGPVEHRPAGEERSNLDLWKSLDEGADPTADDQP